jgi:hypothetical protein
MVLWTSQATRDVGHGGARRQELALCGLGKTCRTTVWDELDAGMSQDSWEPEQQAAPPSSTVCLSWPMFGPQS